MSEFIENKPFNEIAIGDSAFVSHILTKRDILLFALMSGDVNPAHVDEEYAKSDLFHQIVAHGMWGASLISTVLGTQLPGPGTIYLGQSLKFLHPVMIGDCITASVTVTAKTHEKHIVTFDCLCINQLGIRVITGIAEIMAPSEKIKRKKVNLPLVESLSDELFKQLMEGI